MDFLTTNEIAELWEISRRRVNVLCSEGRIDGAIQKGRIWLIPKDTQKPQDPRRANYSLLKKERTT